MLYRRLEGIGAAELGIYDNEADGPVDDNGEANEEGGACDEACVAESVRLADNTSAAVPC